MRKLLRAFWFIITAPFRFLFWFLRTVWRWIYGIFSEVRSFFRSEPEDTPLPDSFAKAIENPTGIFYHLEALRKHLLRSVAVLGLTSAFSFYFTPKIADWLAQPAGGIEALTAITLTEQIGIFMKVALLSGFTLALPYIALEIWLFIAPGIGPKARLYGLFAIPAIGVFFAGGMLFAFYIMLPAAIPFLISIFPDMGMLLTPNSTFSFTIGLMFWVGVSFEFPLVIFVLAGMGIVDARMLITQWRLAIVLMAVLSALITPTIDPLNMSLVMGPMIVLYFLSIGLAVIARRGR